MFGNCWLRHREGLGQICNGGLSFGKTSQNGPPRGIGQRCEGGIEIVGVRLSITCQLHNRTVIYTEEPVKRILANDPRDSYGLVTPDGPADGGRQRTLLSGGSGSGSSLTHISLSHISLSHISLTHRRGGLERLVVSYERIRVLIAGSFCGLVRMAGDAG